MWSGLRKAAKPGGTRGWDGLGSAQQAARELQLFAAHRLPLLTGAMEEDAESITVRGRLIARDGLHAHMKLFINGLPFEELDYPVYDAGSQKFSEFGGDSGFKAVTREYAGVLRGQAAWRIEAAPFGTRLPSAWRAAWWFANPRREQFPIPSRQNIVRVIGDDNPGRFLMGGLTIYKNITHLLGEMGLGWSELPRVLDWGCGCGRLTRFLLANPALEVEGADIDADNVAWCDANLARGRFTVLAPEPPTPYADAAFDMVIGCSVMTHLAHDMQYSWLDELRRIIRPGGLAFLSVSGACQFAHMGISPALYQRVQKEGFVDSGRDPALDGFISDHGYYRASWHSHAYIAAHWSRYFDVLMIEDGIAGLQDFVVMRRRT